MLGASEYTLCSPFRANAHNSSLSVYLIGLETEQEASRPDSSAV